MAEKKEVHLPRYFLEQDDPLTIGKKVYSYKRNYEVESQSKEEGLDIF